MWVLETTFDHQTYTAEHPVSMCLFLSRPLPPHLLSHIHTGSQLQVLMLAWQTLLSLPLKAFYTDMIICIWHVYFFYHIYLIHLSLNSTHSRCVHISTYKFMPFPTAMVEKWCPSVSLPLYRQELNSPSPFWWPSREPLRVINYTANDNALHRLSIRRVCINPRATVTVSHCIWERRHSPLEREIPFYHSSYPMPRLQF